MGPEAVSFLLFRKEWPSFVFARHPHESGQSVLTIFRQESHRAYLDRWL